MNKIIFILFITLVYPVAIFSQPDYFGFKFGIQSAGVSDNQIDTGRIPGFSLYGFADLPVYDNFNLNIDLGVTQRGYKSKITETNEEGKFIQDVTAASKLTYISAAVCEL